MSNTEIEIRPVSDPAGRKRFIRLASTLYADDPHYVAPLEFELGARLDGSKNPGLKISPHQLWIAYKNGEPVGRIAAIVNKAHLDHNKDGVGHFGFFESVNDPDVAHALLKTAEDWLRGQGMTRIGGPYNFSVNEECGLLIDGFDTPPFIMMPHNPPYYSKLLEEQGYAKAMDMFALWIDAVKSLLPEKRKKFIDKAMSNPKVSIRRMNTKDFLGDIRTVLDIYSDAWSDNWGYVPFSEEQIAHMAKELRPIIKPHNLVICSYDGEPAAFGLILPNINAIIHDFNGKLLPFNWAKLLWGLKVKNVPHVRMPLMGVRKKFHRKPIGAAFAYRIIEIVHDDNSRGHGVTGAELSWILENNEAMLAMLYDLGATVYKTYRVYEKPL